MADAAKNDDKNVSAGKGVAGGYFFVAPKGTTMPTDLKTKLDEKFTNLGFVSEDGIAFATETDSEELRDMNGDVMDTSKTSHAETLTVTFAEVKKDVMAVLYGSKNVTDASGLLTVHVKPDEPEEVCAVLELVLKNGRRWRRLIPSMKLKELGDLTIASSELMGREATFAVMRDAKTGDFYTDFYDSTETAAAMAMSAKGKE